MKNLFIGFLFLLSFTFKVSAQFKETVKFDEFESPNCESFKARLDTLRNALEDNSDSKAFIISYEGKYSFYDDKKKDYVFRLPKFGQSSFINQEMMDYLFFNRGLEKDKVLFINGGFRERYMLEFWLVPRGAKSPEITPTLTKINYRKGKFSNFCGDS